MARKRSKALDWILDEAKRLRQKYPDRFKTWREYVAQASAIYASKHGGKSPVGRKKSKMSDDVPYNDEGHEMIRQVVEKYMFLKPAAFRVALRMELQVLNKWETLDNIGKNQGVKFQDFASVDMAGLIGAYEEDLKLLNLHKYVQMQSVTAYSKKKLEVLKKMLKLHIEKLKTIKL